MWPLSAGPFCVPLTVNVDDPGKFLQNVLESCNAIPAWAVALRRVGPALGALLNSLL